MPIQRLAFAEMPRDLQVQLEPRVARLGYLGEFFAVGAHQPDALAHFIGFTESLKAALPARTVEIVALTIATLTDNAYERVQHERLALAIGMDADEIRQITRGELDSPSFTPAEALAGGLAATIVRSAGREAGDAVDRLAELIGSAGAVAVVLTAARYLAHAAAANAWELTPPVSSPLEDTEARA